MPLHHAHEPYVSPAGLTPTLQALGVGGVVLPGALAWDSYPRGANPISVVPSATTETDGSAATLIAAAAITVPYYLTHFVFSPAAAGDFQLRFKLQNSTPVIYRTLRACNDFTTGPMSNMQSPGFPPFPVAASLGVQAILATAPGTGPTQLAYVTALKQSSVMLDPRLLSAYSVSHGDVLPPSSGLLSEETDPTVSATIIGISLTTSSISWVYGSYVEITSGLPTDCLITAVWGNVGDSVDHVQATFATGLSSGEIDWGTFAWPKASNSGDPSDCRHNLLPFPLYLPANTRLVGKARSNGTTQIDFRTSVEYVTVPLR